MQFRYRYRVCPSPGQKQALARAFGCARTVFNDSLRLREECHASGEKIGDSEIQRTVITLAKLTPARAWLGEAPSVALVQRAKERHVARAQRALSRKQKGSAGWAQLLRLVEEKARHYGRTFYRTGRFVPTSQTCSECGASGPKLLSVRTRQCGASGAVHDRDVNAARNILAAGRADRLNACEGNVRPPPMVAVPAEAGTHRSAA